MREFEVKKHVKSGTCVQIGDDVVDVVDDDDDVNITSLQ